MSVPSVSCVIDKTPPAHRIAMMRMRVSSPSAAKFGALNAERRVAACFRAVWGQAVSTYFAILRFPRSVDDVICNLLVAL